MQQYGFGHTESVKDTTVAQHWPGVGLTASAPWLTSWNLLKSKPATLASAFESLHDAAASAMKFGKEIASPHAPAHAASQEPRLEFRLRSITPQYTLED